MSTVINISRLRVFCTPASRGQGRAIRYRRTKDMKSTPRDTMGPSSRPRGGRSDNARLEQLGTSYQRSWLSKLGPMPVRRSEAFGEMFVQIWRGIDCCVCWDGRGTRTSPTVNASGRAATNYAAISICLHVNPLVLITQPCISNSTSCPLSYSPTQFSCHMYMSPIAHSVFESNCRHAAKRPHFLCLVRCLLVQSRILSR